ncbi:MAG TPA: TIGR01777 family oxidoreductase [Opitutaceae bacterium]|nr:TIGR01777 family oxidoreductase [Opitutaceae bacterium]
MEITIAGASGLIGTAVARSFEKGGHQIRRLVRGNAKGPGDFSWKPDTGAIDPAAIEGADVVINLAGANIAGGRWTQKHKGLLRDSRVCSTDLIARCVAACVSKPAVLVNASGVGYYGTDPEGWIDEQSPLGGGFLAGLCSDWENAAEPAVAAGVRVVKLRFGVVIASEGGALAKMLPVFKLGLGGPIGGGRMWLSWISIVDLVRVLDRVIADPKLVGAVNAVAPNPVTNLEFTKELGRALGRPAIVPVPAWALRLALGEMADETLLASARARPARLLEAGFAFRHETIAAAFADLLGSRR